MIKLTTTEIQLIARQTTNKIELDDPENKPSFEKTFGFITDILDDVESPELSRQQFNMVLGVFYTVRGLQNSRSTAVLDTFKKDVNKTFDRLAKAKKDENRAKHAQNMEKHAQRVAKKAEKTNK